MNTPHLVGDIFALLRDPNREFVSSDMLMLETLPKVVHFKNKRGETLLRSFFSSCIRHKKVSTKYMNEAYTEACTNGLGGVDALHIVLAESAKAKELITLEKKSKPMYKTKRIKVIHLSDI